MLTNTDIFHNHPEAEELIRLFRYEIAQNQRPASEIIFDDVDLRNYLKVSKRTTATLREKRIITYSKLGGKIYYKLSDILALIESNQIPAISKNLKIAL